MNVSNTLNREAYYLSVLREEEKPIGIKWLIKANLTIIRIVMKINKSFYFETYQDKEYIYACVWNEIEINYRIFNKNASERTIFINRTI